MKLIKSNSINSSNLCILHNQEWLDNQRIAGKITAQALSLLQGLVKDKTTKSLLELDQIVEQFILDNDCTPTFKNYKGFPASVCMSVDNEKSHAMVHGIPFDYKLQDGDLISFDLGATYKGAIADSARSCIYGDPKSDKHIKLIYDTKEALQLGIQAVKVGDKLGVIGQAIYKYLSAKGYGVITDYGGHSLSYSKPHSFPFISNKGAPSEGITIQAGMTLAIEPMAELFGATKTWTGKDGWTVYSENASCHFEDTIFVHSDHIEIIT